MKKIGTFAPRSSKQIRASKIGVGFECVERKMWDDTEELYRAAGELGVKHARVMTGWFRCEREKGIYDFEWLEKIVNKLLAQGIRPWFCVCYGNKLYCDSPADDAAGYPPLFSEEARTAWTRYATELATRFRGRVTHFEVWNEPNCSGFWKKGPDYGEYVDLVRITSTAIRACNPEAKIIGGASGMSISWWIGHHDIYEYIKRGICPLIDAFTFHRYHILPELNRPEDLRMLRAMFDENGGKHVELWQGESGCTSKSAETEAFANLPVNEEIQVKVALRSIMTDLKNGLDYTCYFTMSDYKYYYRNGLLPKPHFFGLVTFDDPPRRKPVYHGIQTLANLFDEDTVPCDTIKCQLDLLPFPPEQRFTFQEKLIQMQLATFRRKGYPLVAWWMPADLIPEIAGNPPYQPFNALFRIWTPGLNIRTPVLIDPISQEVFEPERFDDPWLKKRKCDLPPMDLSAIPVRDYPMILTDREAVREMIRE